MHRETHLRSFTKAITWTIVATVITMVLVYVHTGNIALTVGIGAFDMVLKLVFYYLHERGWHEIHWGKKSKK